MTSSRRSTRLFDRVIMIDWSAQATPKRGRDSIWMAVGTPHDGVADPFNPSTRTEAIDLLIDVLHAARHERVLVGLDFSFGYPVGFAPALTGDHRADWSHLWTWLTEHLSDDDRNRNDRFEVAARLNEHLLRQCGVAPFWGYPGRQRCDALTRTRPPTYAPFPEFRLVEQRLRSQGHRPFSAWQLAYAGSVGSQMMLGMRALQRLRRHDVLGQRVKVWPFDTGFGMRSAHHEPGDVLVAEIWPSMITVDPDLHPVRDAAQVLALTHEVLQRDDRGQLAPWFDPVLSDHERAVAMREEGWTLGVE